jgi:hypothetical protein
MNSITGKPIRPELMAAARPRQEARVAWTTGSTLTAVPYTYNSAAPCVMALVLNRTLTTASACNSRASANIRSDGSNSVPATRPPQFLSAADSRNV